MKLLQGGLNNITYSLKMAFMVSSLILFLCVFLLLYDYAGLYVADETVIIILKLILLFSICSLLSAFVSGDHGKN